MQWSSRSRAMAAAVAALALTPRAQAQTWQVIGTPDNSGTGAYWNNPSDDNVGSATCNLGAILTNTPAVAASSCSNQRPDPVLPLVPVRLGTTAVFLGGSGGSAPGGFLFAGGVYAFDEVARVAGNTATSWGVITTGGVVFTSTQLRSGGVVGIAGPFAIWITQALPNAGARTMYTSNGQTWNGAAFAPTTLQQFVVLTGGRVAGQPGLSPAGAIQTTTGDVFYVGMEDNVNGGRGFGAASPAGPPSDRDYNDIIIRIRTINTPEPRTLALLFAGLLPLAAARVRRHARRL